MLFSEVLSSIKAVDGAFEAEIGDDWAQGRATYGGLIGAIGNETMRKLVPAERLLRALDVTFVGPAPAGKVSIRAEVLRTGKSVAIAQARIMSGAETVATMVGVYGLARPSVSKVEPKPQSGIRPAVDIQDVPNPPGFRPPAFLKHFALRWAEGTRPFTGSQLSRSKAYIHHQDRSPMSESHVIAIMDCVPSPALQMMTKPAHSSSLTWNLEFLRHDFTFTPEQWWRLDTEVLGAGNGYVSQSYLLINPSGMPAAVGRQLVTVFG
jgi:acyl-CoA thioesterase